MTNEKSHSPANIVILDRDGVINEDSEDYIKSPEEWIPIPGSIEAIARLSQAGYRVVVATNQSGIGRHLFSEVTLALIHHRLCSMVAKAGGAIAGIYHCPHLPEAKCSCRKPATGLLIKIEHELNASLAGCNFIGDSEKDIQAALAHGCNPVLVRTGNGRLTEQLLVSKGVASVAVFDNLLHAVQQLYLTDYAD